LVRAACYLLTSWPPRSSNLLDSGLDLVSNPPEDREPLLPFALGSRRILERPMQPLPRAGKDRAGLVGVAADCDDVLEGFPEVALQRLRILARDVEL
jgi:hypothetical protein